MILIRPTLQSNVDALYELQKLRFCPYMRNITMQEILA